MSMQAIDVSTDDAVSPAVAALHHALRAAATATPDALVALVKDTAVLIKLLRNPADNPDEPKFRTIKLTNAAIARVLANAGVKDVLLACGFATSASGEALELGDVSAPTVALLLRAVEAVEAVHHMLQELHWLHAARAQIPSLAAHPWTADAAAKQHVQACLSALHAPGSARDKVAWVQSLHVILSTPEMHACHAALTMLRTVAVPAARRVALELINEGAFDVPTLMLANQCLAKLWPPGDPHTLPGRLEFCFACLEAALPNDDETMELRLRLTRGNLLGSTVAGLGAFSEVGVRCGVLRQELTIEYEGEAGQDAGGLLRQFFDLFSGELAASPLWARTPAGGLHPAESAPSASSSSAGARAAPLTSAAAAAHAHLRAHMQACGRVCGMALYQELHRRRDPMQAMLEGGSRPPNLLGAAFARHFVRLVQQDPPDTLAGLQAELAAETSESCPDYRAGSEILSRSLAESGLEEATFTRVAAGGVEVPLVEGGAARSVTDETKREWLELLLRAELVEGLAEASNHFRSGLLDVIGMGRVDAFHKEQSRWTTPHLFLLSASELQQQWSGAAVSRDFVNELESVAVVHPDVAEQAAWLWQVMLELDDATRAKVFRFITGSSRRPCDPADFKIAIGPKAGGDGAYPFAHACANALDMPSYSSAAILRARLEAAVEAAHDTFTDL